MSNDLDQEIEAIRSVLSALEPLSPKVRVSVLNYVTNRLDMAPPTSVPAATPPGRQQPTELIGSSEPTPRASQYKHIKDLKEAKKPKSNNEMAALVAYYLAHVAPPKDRKDTINQKDIQTYFRIADYPLPTHPRFTLQNAKAAGYLDMAGGGEYRLNPVGHNLVKHSLPRDGSSPADKKKATKKKTTKKRSKKKTTTKKAAAKKRTKKK